MEQVGIIVTIPGDLDEPQAFAGVLAIAFGEALLKGVPHGTVVAQAAQEISASAEGPVYEGPEGVASLHQLLDEIAPSTRIAVRTIAEAAIDGGSIHSVELRAQLGLGSPSALAGVLTSLGFAEKRTGLPKPYTKGWEEHDGAWGNTYSMEPEIAQTILDLVEVDGQLRTP